MNKIIRRGLLGAPLVLLAMQVVPYGRDHSNPPTHEEPAWDSARTRELAMRACFDCHSNRVEWPWYSHVAPVSWLVQYDVDEGRAALNFSEWHRAQEEGGESAESVENGEMPPRIYTVMHGHARLAPSERQELIAGLQATMGEKREH